MSTRREAGGGPGVTYSEQDGLLVARDTRLFRPGREAFCRRLAGDLVRRGAARKVHVSLKSGACRVEFAAGRVGPSEAAERFAGSVRAALTPGDPEGVAGPGRDRGWTALTAFPDGGPGSAWETTRSARGRLSIRNPALGRDRALTRKVAREVRSTPGVVRCRASWRSPELRVRFDPEATSAGAVVSAAEGALRRQAGHAEAARAADETAAPVVATGLRRVGYLALAGGSFGLTLVALAVPGVPTVPFLLTTSYYLVRSSPALNRRLLRSRFFGPILHDLQTHGGLRPANKVKLVGLGVALGGAVLLAAGAPVEVLAVAVVSLGVTVFAVARLPGVPTLAPAPAA